MSQQQPPAGWYPDTSRPGQQRWWDGTQWTTHTAPLGPGPTARPSGALPQLAGFGQRLGAALLDALIISIPILVLIGLLFAVVAIGSGATVGSLDTDGANAAAGGLAIGAFAFLVLALLSGTIAPFLYAVGFEGSPMGQTIGKWAVGIRVVDGATAGRLPTSRAFVRVLVRSFASGAIFGLGYLWMLWDDQNRTWHDLAADSRVVVVPGQRRSFRDLLRSWTLRS